jgi:15-cis-phytoene synthase
MHASSSKRPLPNRTAKFEADLAACRKALRGGSHTFFAASLILPQAVRGPASALYAFCRLADDAIDLATDHHAALEGLHRRLARAYAGDPVNDPADRAFAATVEYFAIPIELPAALLDGFAWDAQGRRYPDIEALYDYSARVAGTVGAMMAIVMGARSPEALARACELGVAMQLTNIARDVGEDARMGRLYLPLDWMQEAGLDPEAWLAKPVFDARLASVVRRLLETAEGLYARGEAGIPKLPLGCRPAIRAAARLYAEIGHAVMRNGCDSVSTRAVVPIVRKLAVLTGAAMAGRTDVPPEPQAPLRAIRYLVRAVEPHAIPNAPSQVAWWNLVARTVRILELFERLDARDQARIGRS